MSIKVPFRKIIEIELMANELLSKYETWRKRPLTLPIDVDDIIEGYFKLSLEFCDLKEHLAIPDVLGATWFDEKIIRIDSSLEEIEGRLAFTMAHEVGHWYMHRPIYEMDKVTVPLFSYGAAAPSAAVVCRDTKNKEPAEWQADQFAARLLTPAKLLRETVISITGSAPMSVVDLEKYTERPATNQNLRKTAKSVIEAGFNNVSVEAMCYRLIDLKLVVDTKPAQATLF